MGKASFTRAAWYLELMQADISPEVERKWAVELAHLLLIVDPTGGGEIDDQRVSLALHLAASFNEASEGPVSESVDKLIPLLKSIQKLLRLQLELLLLGNEMSLEIPIRFNVHLATSGSSVKGGLSCSEMNKNNQVFALGMGYGNDDTPQWVQLNFGLALSGLPRNCLGSCPECGRYFIVARKGNIFCSNKCSAKAGMRTRRKRLKENPKEYEGYLETERERSHEKYQKRILKQSPKVKVERRPRKPKKKE